MEISILDHLTNCYWGTAGFKRKEGQFLVQKAVFSFLLGRRRPVECLGCSSIAEIVEKVHSQLYCILLGLMWTLCEICVSISEISLFCLKKGLILVHCY